MPIIRRNSRIYATLGTCYSVWMTVWYAYPAHSRPKRVEKRNKHTKNCAPSWLYLQEGSLRISANEEMDLLIKHGDIVRYIKAQRISWVGHIVRLDKGRTVKRITVETKCSDEYWLTKFKIGW